MLKRKSKILILFLGTVTLCMLSACSSRTVVESDLGIKGAPAWVNEGNQAFKDGKSRLFRGIGSAPKMTDVFLQQSVANQRARAEIAQVFNSYIDIVANDYSASVSDGSEAVDEQAVSRTLGNITKLNLVGVEIIAHWKDKKTGTIYSLAELDMKKFKSIAATAESMNANLKTFIEAKAENIFDKMNTGK